LDEFWLMIWHENVHVVVALVLLVEGGKVSVCQIATMGQFDVQCKQDNIADVSDAVH
jgi:protein tyrosine phosphatase